MKKLIVRAGSTYPLFSALALALAFTLSCSSDKDDDKTPGGGANGGNPGTSGGGLPSEYTGGSCNASDYGRVEIGGRVWMAKNWGCYAQGSKCYNNDPANCAKYGMLYDWATAMSLPSKCNSTLSTDDAACAIRTPHKGICPSGWHIPSDAEWTALETAVGGESTAGKHLKAKEGWSDCGPSGSGKANLCEDTYNFSALRGGGGNSSGNFGTVGSYGSWWSASEGDAYGAYGRDMGYYFEGVLRSSGNKSYFLLSVRCVKDSN